MTHLIEPYNAYQKPPRKKHWTEIAEEEALHYKIAQAIDAEKRALAEARETALRQMAIDEAIATRNHANQNIALPQYAAQPPAQQVQDGQYASPAGGGGWVNKVAEELTEPAEFVVSPSSGVGPLTVNFINQTVTPEDDTFLWDFGSGSLTSTLANPPGLTYMTTGSFTVTLTSTSQQGYVSTATRTVNVVRPTVIAALTGVPTTGPAPLTVQFTGSAVYNGYGSLAFLWEFGSGSATSTSQNPSFTYNDTGSYTVSLQVTESSYNLANKGTRANYISASVP